MQISNKVQKAILIGIASTALFGCFDDDDDDKKTPDDNSVIAVSGKASKGIIKQGIVSVYKLNSDGSTGEQLATTPADVFTQDDGSYAAELADDYEGAIKIVISAGSNTTMLCDVVDDCGETAFGSDFVLNSNFELSAVANATKGDEETTQLTTNVTPLTNVAAMLLSQTLAGSNNINLENAIFAVNTQIAELFNFGAGVDVSKIEVVDITSHSALQNVSAQAFQAAAIASAIAAKATQSNDFVNFLMLSAQDIASNQGTIKVAEAGSGEAVLSLADTLAEIKNLNAKLQSKIIESIQNSDLSETDKAAAITAANDTFQGNTGISSAITDMILETQQDIDDAGDSDRAGDEFDQNDITDIPTGASVTGKLVADEREVSENGEIVIDVLANDTLAIINDSSAQISLTSVSEPMHGSASIVDGKINYIPDPDYNGEDEFTYTVTALELTFTAKVRVMVTAQDDVLGGDFELFEDESRTESAIGPLDAGNVASIEIITAPQNGTAEIEGTNIKYTPNADFNGTDTLAYQVNLTDGNTEQSSFNYTITPVTDAINDELNIAQYQTGSVNVLDNDKFSGTIQSVKLLNESVEADTLTTEKGEISITADGVLTYQPIGDAVGSDSFSYQVTTDSGIIENAMVNVEVGTNEPTGKAMLMVQDLRNWGAYLFPDDFEGAGTLVEDTQAMLKVVETAAPIFEQNLTSATIVADVAVVVEQIMADINNGETDATEFNSADYDASLSGMITVQQVVNHKAMIIADVMQGEDKLNLNAEFTVPAPEDETSEVIEKQVKAVINQGMLEAGGLSVSFAENSLIDVVIAGRANTDEAQDTVLEILFDLTVNLKQQAQDELAQMVEFDGGLTFSLTKGEMVEVRMTDADDNSEQVSEMNLYLPTDVTAKGKFTTNETNTFEAIFGLSISNAKLHTLPNGVDIEYSDSGFYADFDIEDQDNWLNAAASLAFYANPKVESQGKITLTLMRTGYEQAQVKIELEDANSALVVTHDTENQDQVTIKNNDSLVVHYNEQGLSEANDKTIIAEIRTDDEANTLLATFEQTEDGLVEVHYTGTNRFETFY
ncbi:Ig-like domain-containing protein [Catenovulum sp. 2E275]|uniref:Ig-like domain-containing protein n=1 Tax=Catenovulum sp. 2E275 TaxID=2980497 RepID=UPI0021D2A8E8|nr:Ig-like domain-containing protein [Catenovulum sp. 2E275]MCU4676410.1 Ig-like domain-containing protein [Catenovulum sp. 2E275]